MKRKNMTRNALITSIISILLCVSMLVGATFAWFTDEVVTGMNTIAAGNLDIELYAGDTQVQSATKLFDDVTLWEPGVVTYETLQVRNVGTLALKYQMTLNIGNENNLNGHKLSEVLKVAVLEQPIAANATRADVLALAKTAISNTTGQGLLSNFYLSGALEAGENSAEQTIVIFWEPNDNATDNLYNANNGQKTSDGKPLHIEFGINLQATQKMSEEDSFGNDYDEFASILPKANVINTGRKAVIARDVDNWNAAGEMMTLDTSYQFLPNETKEQAVASQYRYWHADWVITVDRPVAEGTAALAGYYKLFGDFLNTTDWIALTGGDIPANTEIRLLKDGMNGASVNYEEICEYANDGIGFLCGAADLTGENAGTTLTVELRIYETTGDPATETGPKNEETGAYKTIGKFQYTFGTNSPAGFKAALSAGVPNIILENDIELNDEPLVITGNTVIDLNGHTITGISTSNTTSNLITVAKGAELTLTGNGLINFAATKPDTEWGGEGQPAFPGYANNTISCKGKLVVDGVTIKNSTAPGGASYAIDCYPGADLVVNSGTIDGMGKCAIRMFCNSNTEATSVTVNGGLITGKRGIWIQLPSSQLTNERLANLTVTGGKIISTNDTDCAIYSYSYGDSFAKTNVTISGGEFTGVVAFGGGEKTTKENVTITGGTFKDGVGRYLENDVWEEFTV